MSSRDTDTTDTYTEDKDEPWIATEIQHVKKAVSTLASCSEPNNARSFLDSAWRFSASCSEGVVIFIRLTVLVSWHYLNLTPSYFFNLFPQSNLF